MVRRKGVQHLADHHLGCNGSITSPRFCLIPLTVAYTTAQRTVFCSNDAFCTNETAMSRHAFGIGLTCTALVEEIRSQQCLIYSILHYSQNTPLGLKDEDHIPKNSITYISQWPTSGFPFSHLQPLSHTEGHHHSPLPVASTFPFIKFIANYTAMLWYQVILFLNAFNLVPAGANPFFSRLHPESSMNS